MNIVRGGFTMPDVWEVSAETPAGPTVYAWVPEEREAKELAERLKDDAMAGTLDAWNVRAEPLGT